MKKAETDALDPTGGQMERLIGWVLVVGVVASVTLIVGGSLWELVRAGHLVRNDRLSGMNVAALAASELGRLLAGELEPRLFVDLGVVVLLLTPFARVLASVFYFAAHERNLKYTVITLTVLAVLSYSLFVR